MNMKKHISKGTILLLLALLVVSEKATADPDISWNTFLGSANSGENPAIAVDGSGNVYMAGLSNATWGTPVSPYSGAYNVFAAKLDSSGNLLWNTFLGSTNNDWGSDIAVDGSGNVYVAGLSNVTWGTPVNVHSGGDDLFAAKLDSSGNLLWNTFLGSEYSEENSAIAVDGSGNVYVAGLTLFESWGSPVNAHSGGAEAFAAKLDNSGNLLWNTFLGSTNYDEGSDIAVDGSGNVYVVGYSSVTWGLPVNPSWSGNAFAAKLDNSGNLLWNTFLGTGHAEGETIAVDGSGNVYVAGGDNGTWGSPVNPYSGGWDAFAAKLDNSGNLLWNTFLGTEQDDWGNSIALDVSGNVYMAGGSGATWGTPVNPYSGMSDAWAVKLITTTTTSTSTTTTTTTTTLPPTTTTTTLPPTTTTTTTSTSTTTTTTTTTLPPDLCPNDPNKTEPGECGCGVADTDSDGDGSADCVDTDVDGDGIDNNEEIKCGSDPMDPESRCAQGLPFLMLLLD